MNDEHGELLMELVASPYWAAVKVEIDKLSRSATNKLLSSPAQLLDVLLREGYAAQLRAYRLVVDVVESEARRARDRLSGDDN